MGNEPIEKEDSWVVISTSVSKEFHKTAKDLGIRWSEALRRGLALEFSDRGFKGFDNRVTIHGQLTELRNMQINQAEQFAKKFETVMERIKKLELNNAVYSENAI
jgi:hypothetical protein